MAAHKSPEAPQTCHICRPRRRKQPCPAFITATAASAMPAIAHSRKPSGPHSPAMAIATMSRSIAFFSSAARLFAIRRIASASTAPAGSRRAGTQPQDSRGRHDQRQSERVIQGKVRRWRAGSGTSGVPRKLPAMRAPAREAMAAAIPKAALMAHGSPQALAAASTGSAAACPARQTDTPAAYAIQRRTPEYATEGIGIFAAPRV